MKIRVVGTYLLLGGTLAMVGLWRAVPVQGFSSHSSLGWNRQSAAHYLDDREVWWQEWPRAQKDHGTICISCHTNVPYAMARPGLQRELGESGMTAPEKTMMDSVEKRVTHWSEMETFYSDAKHGPGKTAESRSTEAVLNAIILASVDARHGNLRPVTRTAFEEAWALQEETGDLSGGWKWQDFHLGPWESSESGYQGAALLMVETMNAPNGYAKEPKIRLHLDRLREYLQRQYASQPVLNQLYILWASTKNSGLLTGTERESLLEAVRSKQEADGGWRTASLDHRERVDHSPEPIGSDGYATGLAVLSMEESGISDQALRRGLAWLASHQQKDGAWYASSVNRNRDPESDASLFMNDAATAYAVLALEKAK